MWAYFKRCVSTTAATNIASRAKKNPRPDNDDYDGDDDNDGVDDRMMMMNVIMMVMMLKMV